MKKNLLIISLLMMACLQTAWAQHGMKVWQNGQYALFLVNMVDSVQFVNLVTDIYLSEDELTMEVGDTKMLTATVYPIDASERSVTWESSNTNVVIVDQTGKLAAVSSGSCTITATATDGSGVKTECQVTVLQLVTSIILSETSIVLRPEETRRLTATVLPENAAINDVTWESSDESVALVINNGLVVALAEGNCMVTCSATDRSGVYAVCQVTVAIPIEYEYVDLGLPSGTLWATCNIGANSPEECGKFFAWGETEPKEEYRWKNYKWCKDWTWEHNNFTKYCIRSEDGYNGFTDDLTELLPEDDAATANWGDDWQMPSYDQILELKNNDYTIRTWSTQNGVDGCLIKSKSNNSCIFLPAGGFCYDNIHEGTHCSYWSRSLNTTIYPSASFSAYGLYLYSNGRDDWNSECRDCGQLVRPVRKQ